MLKCTKRVAIFPSLPASLFVMNLTINCDVSLNPGRNVEASKTQTDHTYAGSVVNTSPRLDYSKSKLYFLKKSGYLAWNLHHILRHTEFSEATDQEGVAETTILEYSGPVTVFRIFALSTHADR